MGLWFFYLEGAKIKYTYSFEKSDNQESWNQMYTALFTYIL